MRRLLEHLRQLIGHFYVLELCQGADGNCAVFVLYVLRILNSLEVDNLFGVDRLNAGAHFGHEVSAAGYGYGGELGALGQFL